MMENKIFGTKLICGCGHKGFWAKEDFEAICAFLCPKCGHLHIFSELQKKQVLDSMEYWGLEEAKGGEQ